MSGDGVALLGELGNHRRAEHQQAAEQFADGEHLAQQDPAADGREHGFQAHQQGGQRGIGVLLADHLQRVAHRAGEHCRIDDARPAGHDVGHGGGLRQQHQRQGHDGSGGKLDGAEQDRIHVAGIAVDDDDVEGEHEGAAQGDQIADVDGEVILDAQQAQAHQRDRHADPHLFAHALAHEHGDDGDQDDVERGDEAGVCGGGVGDADLLQRARAEQDHAQHRAQNQVALHVRLVAGAAGLAAQQGIDRKEHDAGDQRAQKHEGEGPDEARGGALRGKGHAPNEGAENQKQTSFGVVFHMYPSNFDFL